MSTDLASDLVLDEKLRLGLKKEAVVRLDARGRHVHGQKQRKGIAIGSLPANFARLCKSMAHRL